jgi:hypothetical protein
MRLYILVFGIVSLFLDCSQSHNYDNRANTQPPKYPILGKIDSSIVAATVKPSDYRWNEEGNLADVMRQKYKPPKIEPGYPNPFSPPTQIMFRLKSDSAKFYFCNENESSCYKFQEGYFEKGIYSIGFQKLNCDTCIFIIKVETTDTTFSKKLIYMP